MDTILFFQPRHYGTWRNLLTGLQRFARERAWLVHVLSRPQNDSSLESVIRHWRPVGCVMDCSAGEKAPPDAMFQDTRVVFLNRHPARGETASPVMRHDSAAVGRLAAQNMLELNLPHYAFVPYAPKREWSEIRGQAFLSAIAKARIPAFEFKGGDLRRWLMSLPKPCGIFAANDPVAQHVVAMAQNENIRIPEDVAVLGVDNDEIYCEGIMPGISSIETDMDKVGYNLGSFLSETIAATKLKQSVRLYAPSRVVERGSTRIFQAKEPGVAEAIDFIRRHACTANIGILDIMAQMKCSRREATQRFKRATGHTILEEIHDVRIHRMRELLETTTMKISTIIGACGYISEAFPKRLFLKRTGMTMRSYRMESTRRNAAARR